MNLRRITFLVSLALCFAAMALVLLRQRQIAELRRQHQDFASPSPAEPGALSEGISKNAANRAAESRPSYTPSVELLRLRNEVTQLANRKRELANISSENDRLPAQLAAGPANTTNVAGLPPGYVLRSRAQMVGYTTPEATLQTFLWALQSRDFANLMQTLTPESAQRLEAQIQKPGTAPGEFFRSTRAIPGVRIRSQKQLPDNSIELQVEFVPGMPAIPPIRLRQIAGQWKLEHLPQ